MKKFLEIIYNKYFNKSELTKKQEKKNENKFSLSYELYFNYFLFLCIFLIIFFFILNFFVMMYLNKSFENDSYEFLDFLFSTINPYLKDYKYHEANLILDSFLKRENLKYFIIYDKNDIIIFYKISLEYKDKNKENNFRINLFEIQKDYFLDNDLSFKINAGFDKSKVIKNISIIRLSSIITYIIILFIFFNVIKYINEKLFLNNIKKLKNILENISKGNFDVKIDIYSNDEIAFIAHKLSLIKNEFIENFEILEYIFNNNVSLFLLISKEGLIKKLNKNYILLFKDNISDLNELINKNLFDYFEELKYVVQKSYELKDIIKLNNFNFNNDKIKNNYFNIVVLPIIIENEVKEFFIKIDDVTEEYKKINNMLIVEKMESLNTLGSGIAHDFNNVLGSINGIISLMQIESEFEETISKDKINEYIQLLNIAINKGRNISNRLLSFSKNIEIKKSLFDLNTVLKNIIDILSVTFDKSVTIETEYYPDKALFYGNENEFEQVFMNICINSYHALTIMRKEGEKWGGKLKISIKKVFYQKQYGMFSTKNFEVVKDKEYWKISFEDNGVGIKKEHINKIFDPFFTTKQDDKGTGLGLSLVYKIVENHEGFITVYSEEGMGTTLNIYLPLSSIKEEILKQIEEQKNKKEIVTINKKCVVIEDDKFILQTLTIILKKFGIEILFSTSNPIEGYNYLKNNLEKVDLIITDYIMPEMNGIDLIDNLFEEKKFENIDIKIILITGLVEKERYLKYLKFEDKFFVLNKPFGLYELSDLLKKIYNL